MIDLSHVDDYEPFQLNENLSYEEKSVQILGREAKTLRQSCDNASERFLAESSFRRSDMGTRG